jgi:(2Fe-2S) ferredoxin
MNDYFKYHVFFCLNQRDNGQACCAAQGAEAAFDYCKAKVKELGVAGVGQVRINRAGCLDRCAGGPVMVVYPQGIWYTFVDQTDIDEIIEEHLIHDRPVHRLMLDSTVGHG